MGQEGSDSSDTHSQEPLVYHGIQHRPSLACAKCRVLCHNHIFLRICLMNLVAGDSPGFCSSMCKRDRLIPKSQSPQSQAESFGVPFLALRVNPY